MCTTFTPLYHSHNSNRSLWPKTNNLTTRTNGATVETAL